MPPDSVRMCAVAREPRPANSSSFGNPLRQRRAVDAEVAAVHDEVLGHREVGIEVVHLRHDAHADAGLARRARHRCADELDRAAVGIDEAEAASQRRRLARAVGAEQPEAFAAADVERQPAHDLVAAIALDEPLDGQHPIALAARPARHHPLDDRVHAH
jgi:hypothetical protein